MKKIISLLILIICMQYGKANNIEVSNVSYVNGGVGGSYVKFDLKWDNSWRVNTGQANYDGAYVFFKYKAASGQWTRLAFNAAASALNIVPAGFEVGARDNSLFVYRSSTNVGIGNVIISNIQAATVVNIPFNIEIRAYAIEMVYIPEKLSNVVFGDGDGTTESAYAIHALGTNYAGITGGFSFNVDAGVDDAAIVAPNIFNMENGNNKNGLTCYAVPSYTETQYPDFPTLGKMWCMKYEITQGAYRDFLNTLNLTQQINRTANVPTSIIGTGALTTSGSYRNYLEISIPSTAGVPATYGCDASGNNVYDEPTDGEFVACNYLNWPDIAAWLDWSGLMPMTEIQFERICRGHTNIQSTNPAYLGEYAWGNTIINNVAGTISNPFAASEIISNSSAVLGNANYSSLAVNAPLRNGVFATSTSNRETSGASFFGVMDMSGNLVEACVGIGSLAGRTFCKTGYSYGDGFLSANGNANEAYWPGTSSANTLESSGGECLYSSGTKNRGGDFSTPSNYLRISDRSDSQVSTSRASYQGGRGVYTVSSIFFTF
jgi:hypothetical protein